jgi:hypothetical protein
VIGRLVRRQMRKAYELGRAVGDEAGYRRGVRDGRVFEQQLRLVEARPLPEDFKARPLRLVKK